MHKDILSSVPFIHSLATCAPSFCSPKGSPSVPRVKILIFQKVWLFPHYYIAQHTHKTWALIIRTHLPSLPLASEFVSLSFFVVWVFTPS